MNDAYEAAVVQALIEHGREPILRYFRADSCIASTRIGIDVLRHFGVSAKSLPVAIILFNQDAIELIEAGTSQADLAKILQQHSPEEVGGPWSVGLGLGGDPAPDKWPGHVVIAIPEREILVDLSADQASRPHKDIPLDPTIWHVLDDEWWAGTKPFSRPMLFEHEETGKRILAIFDRTDKGHAHDYRQSPNWRRTSTVDRLGPVAFHTVTTEIIRAVQNELDATGKGTS